MTEHTVSIGKLELDGGQRLPAVEQRVTIYGEPKSDGSNVVLVTHALTGSSRVQEWWPGMIGDGRFFDPSRWCVVGINVVGGCYGSTGPTSPAPDGAPYGARFPHLSVGDIVRAEQRALASLGIKRLAAVIGGSVGGMQALQWAIDFPESVEHAIAVGAHDHHSSMGIALNALQRDAIALDPQRGLRLARKIAMLTYKSEELFSERHARRRDRHGVDRFDVEGYLEHQADLFERRMDAQTYVTLTHVMDSFDVRGTSAPLRSSDPNATLRQSTASNTTAPEILFVGITSDWLFRSQDVRAAAESFASRGWNAHYVELQSEHGHDAFLAEPDALAALIGKHLCQSRAK